MIIDHGREFPGAAFVQSTVKEFASETGDAGILYHIMCQDFLDHFDEYKARNQ